MVPSYMASKEERMEQFDQTQALMERFAKTQEFDLQQLEDPQTRVDFLKTLSAETFMDFLAVVNSKFRGNFERWRRHFEGKVHGEVVRSGTLASPDIEPPNNQSKLFSELFRQMQNEISSESLDLWAAKLYSAVVFLHMFPDANGRTAQQVFAFIKTGKMTPRDNMSESPQLIKEYGHQINTLTIEQMLIDHGNTRFKYQNLGGLRMTSTYTAEDKPGFNKDHKLGLTARLKFMAAKEAGLFASRSKDGDINSVAMIFGDGEVVGFTGQPDEDGYGESYVLQTKAWSGAEHLAFYESYSKIRDEWFWESQAQVEQNYPLSALWIDIAMKIPNQFNLQLPEVMVLVLALQDGQHNQARTILAEEFNSGYHREEVREQYIEKLKVAVEQHPELVQRVREYVESQGL